MPKLTRDGYLLCASRMVRMFAYGFLSVVLVLYLSQLGLSEFVIGLLLSLTLLGDTAVSLWITTNADRFGRKRMLIVGAGLMFLAGVVFSLTDSLMLLLPAAILGVMSPSVLIPLMPSFPWAVALLLLRFSISQMDVPTRQAYTVSVVASDERSAAAGVTGVARTIGSAISPTLSGYFLGSPALMGIPFMLAGGLKIAYDLLLYRNFRKAFPAEEGSEGEGQG